MPADPTIRFLTSPIAFATNTDRFEDGWNGHVGHLVAFLRAAGAEATRSPYDLVWLNPAETTGSRIPVLFFLDELRLLLAGALPDRSTGPVGYGWSLARGETRRMLAAWPRCAA